MQSRDISWNLVENLWQLLTSSHYNCYGPIKINFLKFQILDADKINVFNEKLYDLLAKVRINAVTFVDSFDYLDSNLCKPKLRKLAK